MISTRKLQKFLEGLLGVTGIATDDTLETLGMTIQEEVETIEFVEKNSRGNGAVSIYDLRQATLTEIVEKTRNSIRSSEEEYYVFK